MLAAAHLSVLLGITSYELVEEITGILELYNLPTTFSGHSIKEAMQIMSSDKKNTAKDRVFIVLYAIGQADFSINPDENLVRQALLKIGMRKDE